MYRIVALDPGGTTGWATYTEYPEADKPEQKFACGQIGPFEHHKDLYDFLGMQQTDDTIVVCESFEYRNERRPGLVLISKEYIGVAKLFVAERGFESEENFLHYKEQTASKAKGFVKDTNLQKLGLWSSGFPHAMDAMRHLLYYMINDNAGFNNMKKGTYELLKQGWK